MCCVQNDVPLKTIDGGSTWVPLDNTPAKISKFGARDAAHPLGALSWSGKTLVVSGADQSAIGRQERVSLACIHYVRLQSVTAVGPRLHLSACLVEYSAWADETLLLCMNAVVGSVQEYGRWGVLDGRDRRYRHGLYGDGILVREGLLPHNVGRGHHRQTQLRALNICMCVCGGAARNHP